MYLYNKFNLYIVFVCQIIPLYLHFLVRFTVFHILRKFCIVSPFLLNYKYEMLFVSYWLCYGLWINKNPEILYIPRSNIIIAYFQISQIFLKIYFLFITFSGKFKFFIQTRKVKEGHPTSFHKFNLKFQVTLQK